MTPLLAPSLRSDRGFERMYRRHAGDVYRYALAMLRNPADAEDVTQTTFLNAYRAYERGERPRAAQNWLITIAHNVCRQRFRQSERRVREVMLNEDVAATLVDDHDTPSIQEVQQALEHLPFNQRSALVLRELEGRSYTEIAAALDLSVSAVETLLFRARRTFREQLEGALTCRDAELALSQQIDGRLPRAERGPLRAHLRECKECATLARKQRAQSAAIKALGAVPLPPSLTSLGSWFGGGAAGGAAAAGGGLALKAAAVLTAGAVVAGAGYEGAKRTPWLSSDHNPSPVAAAAVQPVVRAPLAGPVAGVEFGPVRRVRVAGPSQVEPVSRSARRPRGTGGEARGKVQAVGKADNPAKSAKRDPTPALQAGGRGKGASHPQGRPSAEPPSSTGVVLQALGRPTMKDKEKGEKAQKAQKAEKGEKGEKGEKAEKAEKGENGEKGEKGEKDQKETKAEKDKPAHGDKREREKKEKVTAKDEDEVKVLPAGHRQAEDELPITDTPKKNEDKSKEAQGPDPEKKADPPGEPAPPPAATTPPATSEPPPPPDPPGEGKDKKK